MLTDCPRTQCDVSYLPPTQTKINSVVS